MSVKAKLIIDEKEINVLWFTFGFNQGADHSGRPSQKPIFVGLQLVIETRKDLNLADWSFAPNQTKQIELHIYPVILGGKTRKLFFYDSHLVNWKNNFNSTGNQPMSETLHITSAGVEDSNSEGVYSAYWRTTFKDDNVKITTLDNNEEEEEQVDLKFIAKLERLDNYKGEFGFDWMRDNYKTICENYEKLKKEYTPTKIHEQDYFVPWLSMFPNQENVKLKLVITEIDGIAKDIDIIKLPTKNGLKFEPNELKVSEANGKEITVICESPLNNDIVISLLDKDDEEVGKLNVFKNVNHKQLQFNITPVRILRSVSPQSDKDTIENMIDHTQGFGDTTKDINGDLQNLQDYLNTQSLNQALLQANIGEVYDVIINEEKWIADDLIIDEDCIFKDVEILERLEKEFKKQHPIQAKKRGLVLFLSPLRKEEVGGEGEIRETDAKRLVIYQSNLWNKESFAHEISHVLGLTHPFQEKNSKEDVSEMNLFITQVDAELNYMLENNYSKNEIADKWSGYKDLYKSYRQYLNIYYRNPYIFEKTKTENIMDYDNSKISFWKYQWNAMQDDMIKFYNIK